MHGSLLVKGEFFTFILVSFVVPIGVYGYLMWKKAISRKTVFLFGLLLIAIAGAGVVLLQRLVGIAHALPTLADDKVFASELSIALYLIPALFAGIGINMISHLLTSHLIDAERRYDRVRK
jgi:hypothetical protein